MGSLEFAALAGLHKDVGEIDVNLFEVGMAFRCEAVLIPSLPSWTALPIQQPNKYPGKYHGQQTTHSYGTQHWYFPQHLKPTSTWLSRGVSMAQACVIPRISADYVEVWRH